MENKFNIGKKVKIINYSKGDYGGQISNGDTGLICSKPINDGIEILFDKDEKSRWVPLSQIQYLATQINTSSNGVDGEWLK